MPANVSLALQIGLLEKAQDLYARAYDIQTAKLGPEHPEVAYTMNYTAGLLKAMGKFSDAESVYRAVRLILLIPLQKWSNAKPSKSTVLR